MNASFGAAGSDYTMRRFWARAHRAAHELTQISDDDDDDDDES